MSLAAHRIWMAIELLAAVHVAVHAAVMAVRGEEQVAAVKQAQVKSAAPAASSTAGPPVVPSARVPHVR